MIRKHWEYYCYACEQLRLYVSRKEEKPNKCNRCQSKNIEIGEVGCPELTKLRYGKGERPPDELDITYY
jgi:hypothetical protein